MENEEKKQQLEIRKKQQLEVRIKQEWKKIRKYKFFTGLREFRKLFEQNPKAMCLKKYPSFDWCEENFFFGTEKELLEWYRTTDEIPFYTKRYIGETRGRLTIIGFRRDKSQNNKLIAICKCECGNIAEFDFRKARHGDNKSCGCRDFRKLKRLREQANLESQPEKTTKKTSKKECKKTPSKKKK